jgi:hypothetical protein
VLLVAALVQAAALAAALVVLPLLPGVRSVRPSRGTAVTWCYFALLGAGFMLLEMGFLQRLVLYLAHPVYSAAAAISGFLIFGGLGSWVSGRWKRAGTAAPVAAGGVVVLSLVYVLGMDSWLGITQGAAVPLRFLVAAVTVAPLAFAMGHMFPLGLARTGAAEPALVPWAWAVNGFASVVATAAAPLLAMSVGFSRLALIAAACYVFAGGLYLLLPGREERERQAKA